MSHTLYILYTHIEDKFAPLLFNFKVADPLDLS